MMGWMLVAWMMASTANSQGFLERLEEALKGEGEAVLGPWLEEARRQGIPWVEGEQVTFLYQAQEGEREVRLASDLHGWDPRRAPLLQRLGRSSLFALRCSLPREARLEYRFVVDGQWRNDPWNPQTVDNGLGSRNNVLTMPGYRPPKEVLGESWRGRVEAPEIPSQIWRESRRIRVYLPPDLRREEEYPVLWVLDGSEYLQRTRLPLIVENLVAAGHLRPCLIVFVDPVRRQEEYGLNPATSQFFVEELVPWVLSRYPASLRREEHALLGASLGGLMAAWMAWNHWEVFGTVLVQSGAFSWQQEAFIEWVRPRPAPLLQVRMSVGEWEGEVFRANERLAEVLAAKPLGFVVHRRPAGHNWTAWRDALPELLRNLWPVGSEAPLLGPPYPRIGPSGEGKP